MSNVLVIGDPHCQMSTLPVFLKMAETTLEVVKQTKPDAVVITGDLNHTHAVCHSTLLNTAYDWIKSLAEHVPVYLLIGNHDMVAPSRFLESDHPFKVLKNLRNITIVDHPTQATIGGLSFSFTPYTPPGRLVEALDLLPDWRTSSAVFAHPEIEGSFMAPKVVCAKGDRWDANWPLLIAGHFHDRQKPHSNVIYVGTPFHHSFGEVAEKTISLFNFSAGTYTENLISLGLPRKLTYECKVENLPRVELFNTGDSFRLKLSGSFLELSKFKKSDAYKEFNALGVKIILAADDVVFSSSSTDRKTYLDVLSHMVDELADNDVNFLFQEVVTAVGV